MWASGARSPEAPTEPREGTTGTRSCSTRARSFRKVPGDTPDFPSASWWTLSWSISRVISFGTGSPTPTAWLRTRLRWSSRWRSLGM